MQKRMLGLAVALAGMMMLAQGCAYDHAAVAKNHAVVEHHRAWTAWKTVEIGGKTADELLKTLAANGFGVSDWAKGVIGKPEFTTLEKPSKVELVRVRVCDLGFTQNPNVNEIYARARALGLHMCPPEVGLYLRLNYPEQPLNEWLWVAMAPIKSHVAREFIFLLYHGRGSKWLLVDYANLGLHWQLTDTFVFMK